MSDRTLLRSFGLLLFLTGAGSLTLEVVWGRLLRLAFGSTTLAISTVLVAYMLGLGLGGLIGGIWAKSLRRPARAYATLELIIGALALLVPWLLDAMPAINRTLLTDLSFWPAAMVRFLIVMVVLLVPTTLMGMTLPIVVAALPSATQRTAHSVGWVYGMNTLGAVAGTLGATFIMFPAFGVHGTNLTGAALDLGAGALGLWLLPSGAPDRQDWAGASELRSRRFDPLVLSYATVGFTALVYEVVWTRSLAMVFGSSAYAFASMLAAFLLGIALGSLLIRRRLDLLERPRLAYAAGLSALGVLSLVTVMLLNRMPDVLLAMFSWWGTGGSTVIGGGLLISIIAMLGPTLILGALFPLLVRTLAREGHEPSRVVGTVYFLNTLGSASGAFLAGFVLIPWLGMTHTILVAVAINFLAASAVLGLTPGWNRLRRIGFAVVAGAFALSLPAWPPLWDQTSLTRGVFYKPDKFLTLGIKLEPLEGVAAEKIEFYRDGLNAAVSIHREKQRLNLRVNGKVDASMADMPTQSLSGHIPFLFGPKAHKTLVIGYASGVTAGAAALHTTERVDVVEIEPAILEASRFFDEINHRPQDDPKVRVIVDDGRIFLSATRERYDVIISEPSNPFLSGCASLFTREYFRAARAALAPDGRLLQWIQLYGLDARNLASIFNALRAEFPYVHGLLYEPGWPDLLLLATQRPLTQSDLARWASLSQPIRNDLMRVQVFSETDIWSLMRLMPADIESWAREYPIENSDDNMFVELDAPWHLLENQTPNRAKIENYHGSLLEVLDRGGQPAPSARLGQLAFSYAFARGDAGTASRLIEAALPRGRSASAGAVLAQLVRPHDLPRSNQLLQEALAQDPHSFEANYVAALALLAANRPEVAIQPLDVLLERSPDDLRLLRLRLGALQQLGRHAEALEVADRLLRSPTAFFDVELLREKGFAAFALGRPADSVRWLGQYLEFDPDNAATWDLLGKAYQQLGDTTAQSRCERNAHGANENQGRLAERARRRAASASQ
jgi:spermidine synthase